jgi:hypothetical protein
MVCNIFILESGEGIFSKSSSSHDIIYINLDKCIIEEIVGIYSKYTINIDIFLKYDFETNFSFLGSFEKISGNIFVSVSKIKIFNINSMITNIKI